MAFILYFVPQNNFLNMRSILGTWCQQNVRIGSSKHLSLKRNIKKTSKICQNRDCQFPGKWSEICNNQAKTQEKGQIRKKKLDYYKGIFKHIWKKYLPQVTISGKGNFKRSSEETKELDDRLKMGVDEERRVKDVSRVSDLEDWRMWAVIKKQEEGEMPSLSLVLKILSLRQYPTVDVLYAAGKRD